MIDGRAGMIFGSPFPPFFVSHPMLRLLGLLT